MIRRTYQDVPLHAVTNSGVPTPLRQKSVRMVRVNLAESPLAWLKARRRITDRQFAAGEQLRADYERAALGSRVTMNWNAPPLDGQRRGVAMAGASTVAQITAKDRFLGAIDELGPGLSDIAWRVICAGEAIPDAEKALNWPSRAGRLVLTLALDRLADHYRLR
jgi:hypothetical protein